MAELKHVDTSHARLAYRESAGKDLPVLMIHGNSCCLEVFRNQIDGAIGGKYRCIAFDLPGHGSSEDAKDPDRTYNFAGYANAAAELLAALKIDRCAVVGWSLGGHIAIDLTQETDAVAGLMISGTPPVTNDPATAMEGFAVELEGSFAAKRDLSAEEIDMIAHVICGENAPYDPFLEKAVARCDGRARELMIGKAARGDGRNQQELAVNSPVPLAIVNGGGDAFLNHKYIEGLPYKNLWGDKVHRFPEIGHAPFWEVPDQFDALLGLFLKDLG